MAKGPLLDEEVRSIIAQIHLQHPDWIAKEVRAETERIVAERQSRGERVKKGWPGLSIVQKELTEQTKSLKKEATEALDQEWSLGASLPPFSISPEAYPDLLKIWRRCLLADETFTIREAQWAARLREVIPGRLPPRLRTESLLSHARWYARRERVWIALGKNKAVEPIDTSDLDATLAWGSSGDWGYRSAIQAGILNEPLSASDAVQDKEIELIRKEPDNGFHPTEAGPGEALAWRYGSNFQELRKESNMVLSPEGDEVFAVWLQRIVKRKDSKWAKLSQGERNRVMSQLYREVAEQDKKLQELQNIQRNTPQDVGDMPYDDYLKRLDEGHKAFDEIRLIVDNWHPSEELKAMATYPEKQEVS